LGSLEISALVVEPGGVAPKAPCIVPGLAGSLTLTLGSSEGQVGTSAGTPAALIESSLVESLVESALVEALSAEPAALVESSSLVESTLVESLPLSTESASLVESLVETPTTAVVSSAKKSGVGGLCCTSLPSGSSLVTK